MSFLLPKDESKLPVHLKMLPPQDREGYRRLELIPGILIWTTFLGSIVLSFIKPLWVIYFIILFSLYWILRVFYFVFYVTVSAIKYKQQIKINWLEELKKIAGWEDYYQAVFIPTYTEPLEVIRNTMQSLLDCDYPKDKMIVVISWEERAKDVYDAVQPQIVKEFG